MTLTIDTERVTELAAAFDRAALRGDDLAGAVITALNGVELTATAPRRIRAVADGWGPAAALLRVAVDTVEGAELDLAAVAAALGVGTDELSAQLEAIGIEPTAPADEVLAALALEFIPPAESIRDLVPGLPLPGADRELDEALARLEPVLLPLLRDGGSLDVDDLSSRQRADLRLLARALGGDDVEITTEELEIYRGAGGDDEYRTVTVITPVPDAEIEFVGAFVESSLRQADAFRDVRIRAVRQATQFQEEFDRLESEGVSRERIAEELDVPLEDLDQALAFSSALAGSGTTGDPTSNFFQSGPPIFDTAEKPDLTNDEYRAAIDGIVVPLLTGVTSLAEVRSRLGTLEAIQVVAQVVDIAASAISTVSGALAAVVPDFVDGRFLERVSDISGQIANVAGRIVDLLTDVITRANNILDGTTVEDRRREFDDSPERRENLRDEGHDPSIRDDDFSGDQRTGGNGLL